jgi:SAM-dependent methyltransferase
VNRETVEALDAINRDFYAAHAREFAATREAPWPGWTRALALLVGAGAAGPARILDLGCGSARLAPWLDGQPRPCRLYVGLDRSPRMLALARRGEGDDRRSWILADLLESAGALPCRDAAFDGIAVFGLFHHLPSFALRRALVVDVLRSLIQGGIAALAFWQFGAEPRFERRALDWERAPGVDPHQLEPGDRLLRWGDSSAAFDRGAARYCHWVDPDEAELLTSGLPVEIVDTFRADGRSGALNLYRVLRRL